MQSLGSKINKLLMALQSKGMVYCIDKKQFYSEKAKRRCTRYTVHLKIPGEANEVKWYFYKQLEVLLFLVGELKELGDST